MLIFFDDVIGSRVNFGEIFTLRDQSCGHGFESMSFSETVAANRELWFHDSLDKKIKAHEICIIPSDGNCFYACVAAVLSHGNVDTFKTQLIKAYTEAAQLAQTTDQKEMEKRFNQRKDNIAVHKHFPDEIDMANVCGMNQIKTRIVAMFDCHTNRLPARGIQQWGDLIHGQYKGANRSTNDDVCLLLPFLVHTCNIPNAPAIGSYAMVLRTICDQYGVVPGKTYDRILVPTQYRMTLVYRASVSPSPALSVLEAQRRPQTHWDLLLPISRDQSKAEQDALDTGSKSTGYGSIAGLAEKTVTPWVEVANDTNLEISIPLLDGTGDAIDLPIKESFRSLDRYSKLGAQLLVYCWRRARRTTLKSGF